MGFRRAMMMTSNYVRSVIQSFVIRTSALNAWYEADYCLERSLDNLNKKDLLYNASLVVTPNSYKESNLYAVIPNSSVGNIVFTRNSTATRLNSSGVVEVVPSQNLLTYSEQFNNANWAKSNASVTVDTAIAPDGTLTADSLIEDTALSVHFTNNAQNGTVIAGQSYNFSVYVNRTSTRNVSISIGASRLFANFISSTGVVGSYGADGINFTFGAYTSTIINSNWIRVSVSGTALVTQGLYSRITLDNTPTAIGGVTPTYTGNGTSGVIIWGAQTTMTSSLQTYFPTTTRFNIPRANYLVGDTCPTLLLEPQRSNLYLNSATLITRTNVVTTATAYTVSFYGTGTITFTGAYIGSLVGTGANNLVSITFTTTTTSLISTVTGSVTNAQLEAGSFPTSYIPTTATLVTRIIDALTVPTPYTSNLITSLGGTLLLDLKDVKSLIRQGTSNGIYIGDSIINAGNCFVIRGNNTTATFPLILKYVAGTVSTLYTLNTASSKIVIKWDGTYINVFINGTQVVTNSAFTTTNMNNFISNSEFVTNIKTMALYPLPLTNAQCLSLSTQ
jgi:hypothetical protein